MHDLNDTYRSLHKAHIQYYTQYL